MLPTKFDEVANAVELDERVEVVAELEDGADIEDVGVAEPVAALGNVTLNDTPSTRSAARTVNEVIFGAAFPASKTALSWNGVP